MKKKKSEVGPLFKKFHTMIQTQFHATIQVLKFDNACEYFEATVEKYFNEHGIIHKN